jgi:intein/homing endonuclease
MGRSVAVDIGTGFISSAEAGTEEKKIAFRKVRDCFFKVDPKEFLGGANPMFGEKMLKKTGAHFIKVDDTLYILGDSAYKMAGTVHKETLRPMAKGVLNPDEPESGVMVGELIKAVAGKAESEDDTLFFCVPADPIDADFNVEYHRETLIGVFEKLGYKNVNVMNEGLAVVFSELADENFTGIGMSCLTPDMPIITKKGIMEIGDMTPGEYVLTRGGTYEKVLEVVPQEKKENILKINFYGSNVDLKLTKDHEVYIKDRDGNEKWVRADQITNEDYMFSPNIKFKNNTQYIRYIDKKHKKNDKKQKEVSEKLARFVGLFLGDGHVYTENGGIFFTFSKEQKIDLGEFVKDVAYDIFGNSTSFIDHETSFRCQVNNKGLSEWFKENCYTNRDEELRKTLPWDIETLNRPARLGLLRGLLDSDGHVSKKRVSFENTSSELTLAVMKLLQSEGVLVTYGERHRDCGEHEIEEGRQIQSTKKTYYIITSEHDARYVYDLVYGKQDSHATRMFKDCDQWNKIRSVEEIYYEGYVFDLKVENDHSFCLPNATVHNCGAGMVNVCYSFMGMPIMSFAISRGGDYIDQNAAKQVNDTANTMTHHKEKGMSIKTPNGPYEEAIAVYYKTLLKYLVAQIKYLYNSKDKKDLPNLFEPIPVVVAGGTSLVGDFVPTLQELINDEKDFPIPISTVKHAEEPLFAVAHGLYQAAILNSD